MISVRQFKTHLHLHAHVSVTSLAWQCTPRKWQLAITHTPRTSNWLFQWRYFV